MTESKKYINKLSGARILIIGGSSGIGYSVAEACLEYGATVILSSSNDSRIKSSIASLIESYPSAQHRVSGHACDLSSPSLESNIHTLFQDCGHEKLDHIVFTAGDKLTSMPLVEVNLEIIQTAAMVRFNAPLLIGKHAPRYMKPSPRSSITLTTGSVSQKPNRDWVVVASYATGLHGMMRNLALDLAPIRVNLISPGMFMTPLWDGVPKEQLEEFMQYIKAKCTTGEVGRPEDVTEAYLFVMRDVNCSGSVVNSNGGFLLN